MLKIYEPESVSDNNQEVNSKIESFEEKNKKSTGLRGSLSGWKASSRMHRGRKSFQGQQ